MKSPLYDGPIATALGGGQSVFAIGKRANRQKQDAAVREARGISADSVGIGRQNLLPE